MLFYWALTLLKRKRTLCWAMPRKLHADFHPKLIPGGLERGAHEPPEINYWISKDKMFAWPNKSKKETFWQACQTAATILRFVNWKGEPLSTSFRCYAATFAAANGWLWSEFHAADPGWGGEALSSQQIKLVIHRCARESLDRIAAAQAKYDAKYSPDSIARGAAVWLLLKLEGHLRGETDGDSFFRSFKEGGNRYQAGAPLDETDMKKWEIYVGAWFDADAFEVPDGLEPSMYTILYDYKRWYQTPHRLAYLRWPSVTARGGKFVSLPDDPASRLWIPNPWPLTPPMPAAK